MTKEAIKEYKKKWYDAHKEEQKLLMKKWYENHKEEMKLYNKNYRENNKEKVKICKKLWHENNKDHEYKAYMERMNKTSYAPKHKSKWTSNEELYLKTNAPYKTAYEIALELGRSESAVFIKAIRLGVSLNKYK